MVSCRLEQVPSWLRVYEPLRLLLFRGFIPAREKSDPLQLTQGSDEVGFLPDLDGSMSSGVGIRRSSRAPVRNQIEGVPAE